MSLNEPTLQAASDLIGDTGVGDKPKKDRMSGISDKEKLETVQRVLNQEREDHKFISEQYSRAVKANAELTAEISRVKRDCQQLERRLDHEHAEVKDALRREQHLREAVATLKGYITCIFDGREVPPSKRGILGEAAIPFTQESQTIATDALWRNTADNGGAMKAASQAQGFADANSATGGFNRY